MEEAVNAFSLIPSGKNDGDERRGGGFWFLLQPATDRVNGMHGAFVLFLDLTNIVLRARGLYVYMYNMDIFLFR